MKLTPKEIVEKKYKERISEAIKKGATVITTKEQATQIFEKLKYKEVLRLNHNYKETLKILKDVRDKLHSEKMIGELEELKDLKNSIIEYINIIEDMALTMPESCRYEGNEILVKRNKDFNKKAIKKLEKSLIVIGNRIEKRETNKTKIEAEKKTDKLKEELGKYCFFELSKVKQLSEPNKQTLIELISTNDLPYSIAMFEYLGFLKYLKAEYFEPDYKLFKEVAKWFNVAERTIKGNIYVLKEFSKENRKRYTADQYKQTVQKEYEKLK